MLFEMNNNVQRTLLLTANHELIKTLLYLIQTLACRIVAKAMMAYPATYCKWAGSALRHKRQLIRRLHMGRVVPEIDPDLGSRIEEGSVNPKKLITRRKFGMTRLPVQLQIIAEERLSRYSDKLFRDEAQYLAHIIDQFKLPDDKNTLKVKRADIKTELEVRDKLIVPEADEDGLELDEEVKFVNSQLHDLIQGRLDANRRDWHYYEYDERAALMYMATRLPPNYACLRTVMREIHEMDPSFKPKSVLDFGSGMGTTVFAVNATWPTEVNEFMNIDISKEQQYLCEYLLRGGKDLGEPLQNVFHKQYLPSSNRVKYDMVVAAFSMLELPNSQLRANTIENLWNKTNDLLVIIERGTTGGFEIINEARNFVLSMSGHDVTKKLVLAPPSKPSLACAVPTAHVFAPCPHEFICPRYLMPSKRRMNICRFRVHYEPLGFGQQKLGYGKEEFSYVVLRKRPNDMNGCPMRWPRVVEAKKRPGKHVIHKLCCPSGALAETVFTKAKYGAAAYKVAKAAEWGDVLPVKIHDTYEVKNARQITSE